MDVKGQRHAPAAFLPESKSILINPYPANVENVVSS